MKTMMKTLFLAALLVPLAAACGDDDDGGTVHPDAATHRLIGERFAALGDW